MATVQWKTERQKAENTSLYVHTIAEKNPSRPQVYGDNFIAVLRKCAFIVSGAEQGGYYNCGSNIQIY